MCKYSSSSLFEPELDSSVFKKSSKEQVEFFWDREQTSNISVSPSWWQFLNPHHFDRVFNFLGVMAISLFNNTDIGNGSSVFVCWIYLHPLVSKGGCLFFASTLPLPQPSLLLKTIGTRLKINQLQKITTRIPQFIIAV